MCDIKENRTLLNEKVVPFFEMMQTLFLSLAILAMFASQGKYLLNNLIVIAVLILPSGLFFIVNFVVAHTMEKALKFPFGAK
ncbi:hypothetical protein [Planomicrobium okeanokoites]|uniref:hypothetical protein n=1 Tax=Planomicrobium okeanokoites TaxID=244 RepID=UPI00248FDC71|nr:hypothetical protein [Planomicrobium okeanokoites]